MSSCCADTNTPRGLNQQPSGPSPQAGRRPTFRRSTATVSLTTGCLLGLLLFCGWGLLQQLCTTTPSIARSLHERHSLEAVKPVSPDAGGQAWEVEKSTVCCYSHINKQGEPASAFPVASRPEVGDAFGIFLERFWDLHTLCVTR